MRFSQSAREILHVFRQTHRRPGARMTLATLKERLAGDLAILSAVSELTDAGYLSAADADTIELTDLGFDAIQRGEGSTEAD
jgi:hypothetical protein